MKNKNIAIIPARGGSKGIPRKNIRLFAGKPLISYSIEAALKSKYIDRVVVSTEDEEFSDIPKKSGAEVIERPLELAQDESLTIDVIFHVIDVLKTSNYIPDLILLLQPTSPLRTVEDIDNAMELFLNNDCESVVSVCEVKHSPYWSFKVEGGYLKSVFEKDFLKTRRPELPKIYMPNGAIYISKPEILRKYNGFYCSKTPPYVMPLERSIDIDDEMDFMLAELVMKKYGAE